MLALEEQRIQSGFGTATVIATDDTDGRVCIQWSVGGETRKSWTDAVLESCSRLCSGDQVLIASNDEAQVFVVGVVGRQQQGPASREVVRQNNHRRVVVESQGEGERVCVLAEDGRELFRCDIRDGETRIQVPSGNLRFEAENGMLQFDAADGIHFGSSQVVEIRSGTAVRIGVTADSDVASSKIELSSQGISMAARHGTFRVESAELRGVRLRCLVPDIKIVAKRLESTVETVVTRARSVYETVENVLSVTARRIRQRVHESYHLRADRVFMKAKKDCRIRGEKIHLG